MKIALISPWWKLENTYPPLGLAYIGAALEEDGHDVKIFDLTLDPYRTIENKIKDVTRFSPDIAGISTMSHNYANALDVAKYIKDETNTYIVFGGPHPTIMLEDVLKNKFIDCVMMGESEDTFLKMCRYFDTGFYGIDGLCYKNNGNIIIQPKKNYIENLDDIHFPARHLLQLDKYKLVDDYGDKMVTIISSRGCPYRCTYCYKGLFGRTYRQRSPYNIIEEIKLCIEEFGYSSFYFIDDLFTFNLERVESLTSLMIKENLDIRWQCLARVNNATQKMFRQMKDAGCYKVHFGIESGNQQILNKVKKGITLEQIRNAVYYCKETDIKTKGYFMLGMPEDTVETMQDTLNFANELKLDDVMFSVTTPFPGTELWNSIDKNKIKSLSDAFYYTGNYDDTDIKIFYNLSDTSDDNIINMMKKAQKIAEETKIKTFCKNLFGQNIGSLMWQLSKIPILKKSGKILFKIRT